MRVVNKTELKRLRLEEWMSQEELAKKAGLALHTVMRLETGKTIRPQRPTLEKLAEVLKVDWRDLTTNGEDGQDPLGKAPTRGRGRSLQSAHKPLRGELQGRGQELRVHPKNTPYRPHGAAGGVSPAFDMP